MLLHRCRCGTPIPQGIQLCPACQEKAKNMPSRHMEYNERRRNKKAAAFYVSSEWRGVRASILRKYDGIDPYALYVQRRVVPADMVHHIVELDEDWSKRLEVTNLIPLSNANHGVISALYKRDEATKKETQKLLREVARRYAEEVGGPEKF